MLLPPFLPLLMISFLLLALADDVLLTLLIGCVDAPETIALTDLELVGDGVALFPGSGGLISREARSLERVRPPFSPDAVVDDFAALLKSYRVSRVTGD